MPPCLNNQEPGRPLGNKGSDPRRQMSQAQGSEQPGWPQTRGHPRAQSGWAARSRPPSSLEKVEKEGVETRALGFEGLGAAAMAAL